MVKVSALAALGVLLLAGCSEVNSAVDQANRLGDKAGVCTEALGLADLNPNMDPEQVRAGAEEKAQRLRELGNEVAEQDLQQTLFRMSDAYLEFEQRKLDHLSGFNEWLQRNLENLKQLRDACL
ncbi:hypothetical protein ABZ639_17625 [Saccharomonospora sp. NPDC006951]